MKIRHAVNATVLGGLLLVGLAGCGKAKSTTPSMDGRWVGFDLAQTNARCEVTIDHGQLDYRGATPDDICRGAITLNEQTEPKQMDVAVAEPPQSAGKMLLMIYDLQGDEIKVAGAPPGSPQRPVDFTPSPQVRVFWFKRE